MPEQINVTAPCLIDADEVRARRAAFVMLLDTTEDGAGEHCFRHLGWRAVGRAVDDARDPDGTWSGCVFFMQRIEGAAP